MKVRVLVGILLAAGLVGLLAWGIRRGAPIPPPGPVLTAPEVVNGEQAPSLPAPQGVPPTPRSSGDPSAQARVRKILEDVLFRFRADAYKVAPNGMMRFQAEEMSHLREGRLLALAYPELMEGFLTDLVHDPSQTDGTRGFAITLLGVLARVGRAGAEKVLVEIAEKSARSLSSQALLQLSQVDREGKYLALYVRKIKEDVGPAYEAVAFWQDATAIRELETVQAKTTGTSGREMETRRNAEDALSKIRALGSPTLDKTVQEVLEGVKDNDWFPWALKVSAMRSIPGSLDSLRKHLDLVEQPYRPTAAPDEIAEATRLVESGQDRATKLALGLPLGPQYALYDDALVAYAELGGKLNEGQRRRLYLFGYACDPKQRLEELLSTGK